MVALLMMTVMIGYDVKHAKCNKVKVWFELKSRSKAPSRHAIPMLIR
eukprot:SAG11_NODE_2869_length_2884_cov_1.716338_3_plen_47_part_00